MANCKWLEIVLAVVIFAASMWPNVLGFNASKWVVSISAVVLFLHAVVCKMCWNCEMCAMCRDKMNHSRTSKKLKK